MESVGGGARPRGRARDRAARQLCAQLGTCPWAEETLASMFGSWSWRARRGAGTTAHTCIGRLRISGADLKGLAPDLAKHFRGGAPRVLSNVRTRLKADSLQSDAGTRQTCWLMRMGTSVGTHDTIRHNLDLHIGILCVFMGVFHWRDKATKRSRNNKRPGTRR